MLNRHVVPNYGALTMSAIEAYEGRETYAYSDGVGIATTGIGVNLRVHGVYVLQWLGFDVTGTQLTGSALAAEQAYIQQLLTEFRRSWTPNQTQSGNLVQIAIDSIMAQRAANSVYPSGFLRSSSFGVSDPGAMFLDLMSNSYSISVPWQTSPIRGDSYEEQLDTVLNRYGVSLSSELRLRDSSERVALLSLAWGGVAATFGGKIGAAMAHDDRAEIWFQIRYATNDANAPDRAGVANRRYRESDLFGLYGANPNESDYAAAYRMYSRHRGDLIYGQAGLLGYETQFNPTNPTAQSIRIEDALDDARQFFQDKYGLQSLNWQGIRVGETQASAYALGRRADDAGSNALVGDGGVDVLVGYDGNDELIGGDGNDVLDGGVGNDVLRGGSGNDRYWFEVGAGTDRIVDSDNNGELWIDGHELTSAGARFLPDAGIWQSTFVWEQNGQRFRGTLVGGDGVSTAANLEIRRDDGAAQDAITIDGFMWGDFGITAPTSTQMGLLAGVVVNNPYEDLEYSPPGSQSVGLNEGQILTASVVLDRAAVVGDVVRFGAGTHGAVLGVLTGDEVLSLGGGYVEIALTPGQSVLSVGIVLQGDIDSSVSVELTATLLPAPNMGEQVVSALQLELQGSAETTWALPNTTDGNDPNVQSWHITGGGANDLLDARLQTRGSEVHGQGGDDLIEGSAFHDLITGYSGNDRIRGGEGRDMIFADSGEDVVEGGAGGDIVQGGNGRDAIFGGLEVSIPDAIDAGTTEQGIDERGDFLQGRDDHDLVVGSTRNDLIGGGAGSDTLVGGAGRDVIFGDRSYTIAGVFYDFHLEDVENAWRNWSVTRVETVVSGALDYSWSVALEAYVDADGREVTLTTEDVGGGADIIHAGAGDDDVVGGEGHDSIYGESGNDYLFGDNGNDLIHGGSGNDLLDGGDAGDEFNVDVLDGGVGDDRIEGAGGTDTLFGGAGADIIFGDDGDEEDADDYIDGEDGNDLIYGAGGNDRIYGGSGNDQIAGDKPGIAPSLEGSDYLDGEEGDDTIGGQGGADVLVGGSGNDTLLGGAGADWLSGGEGVDSLYGDDATVPAADHDDDRLDGGSEDDVLVGMGRNDILIGGQGADFLWGDSNQSGLELALMGADTLDGGAGVDQLVGGGGNDILRGGDGNDSLYGDDALVRVAASAHGADTLDGGDGNDLLVGGGGTDVLLGGTGNDTLYGDSEESVVAGNDILDGGAGNDILVGHAGNDTLLGGEGNDLLQGGDGDDVLIGGAGIDVLQGGAGNDTYIFDVEDLQVIGGYANSILDTQGNNRIIVGGGLYLDDFEIVDGSISGSITLLGLDGNSNLGLIIQDAFAGAVREFEFSGGEVIAAETVVGQRYHGVLTQALTADGAVSVGGANADTISSVGDGATISGGRGNDSLTGGTGSTTYRMQVGDGIDSIYDPSHFVASSGLDVNVLQLGEGFDAEELFLSYRAGDNALVLNLNGSDAVRLMSYSLSDVVSGARTLDTVAFADQSSVSWDALVPSGPLRITNEGSVSSYTGSNVADVIVGADVDESINSGAGNDTIDARGGNDVLTGGAGSDTYVFGIGSGKDTIKNFDVDIGKVDRLRLADGIAPQDVRFIKIGPSLLVRLISSGDEVTIVNYFTTAGLDEIVFEDETAFTAANVPWEMPEPRAEAVLQYSRGDGAQTFVVVDAGDAVLNTLQFGANVDPESILVESDASGNVIFRFRNEDGAVSATDRIVLTGALLSDEPTAKLDRVTFLASPADSWSGEDLEYRAMRGTPGANYTRGGLGNDLLSGGAGNDLIRGGGGADTILGGEGDDALQGEDGDDSLDGGVGSDVLQGGAGADILYSNGGSDSLAGGAGSDTYVLGLNANNLTISADTSDTLHFGPGILPSQITGRREGLDFVLGVHDAIGSLLYTVKLLNGGISPQSYIPQQTEFEDSEVIWSAADLSNLRGIGTAHGDALTSSGLLDGGAGDDSLSGYATSETLRGGLGNDTLWGDTGVDTYLFDAGDGWDRIADSGSNILVLGPGIAPGDVSLIKTSYGLVLRFQGSDDQINIANWTNGSVITSIVFNGGATWNSSEIAALAVSDGATAQSVSGTSGNDTFTVDHINDAVSSPGAGIDTVQASISYEISQPGMENLTLTGSLNLSGTGNSANNTITGNDHANLLDGGSGTDTLIGGKGDDVYFVDSNQDVVIEAANEGVDTIEIRATAQTVTLAANVENLRSNTSSYVSHGNIVGNSLDNVIDLSGSTNSSSGYTVNGGAGADTMIGNGGWTTYYVDNVNDVVIEHDSTNFGEAGDPEDEVYSSVSFQLGANLESLFLQGSSAIAGTGNSENNYLESAINPAANSLAGGAGDDTYHIGANDSVTEGADGGRDRIILASGTAQTFSMVGAWAEVEDIELLDQFDTTLGGVGASNVIGNDKSNVIVGNAHNNVLFGGAGDDELIDTFNGDNDVLQGGAGNDLLRSYGGDDVLDGGAGDDVLIKSGEQYDSYTYVFGRNYDRDRLQSWGAQFADDTVAFDASVAEADIRVVRDGANLVVAIHGTDDRLTIEGYWADAVSAQMQSSVARFTFLSGAVVWDRAAIAAHLTTGANVATGGADTLAGNANDNVINGLAGNDLVSGGEGADQLFGDRGDDEILGEAGADTISGGGGDDLLRGGAGGDSYLFSVRPNGLNEVRFGNDVIADTEAGQSQDAGMDVIKFDSSIVVDDLVLGVSAQTPLDLQIRVRGSSDRVTVQNYYANGGDRDRIEAIHFESGNITWNESDIAVRAVHVFGTELVDELEAHRADGAVLLGYGGNDELVGGAGADLLDGGEGFDTMGGGAGDDVYLVNEIGDTVVELDSGGVDAVRSVVTYSLADHVENLTLEGTRAIDAYGNFLDNILIGNSAANTLDGGAGADELRGGGGNDTYVVDSSSDVLVELANQGVDTVQSSIDFALAEHFENLTLIASAIAGTGNAASNQITGNANNNVLDGGAGADTLVGGAGDDTYFVDNVGDTIVESASEGADRVISTVSITLSAHVERLELQGEANLSGTGSAESNWIRGNTGNNVLNGAAGNDTLEGLAGDDTYVVDSTDDVIIEDADRGYDSVQASASYVLSDYVEALTLTGSASINATGNSAANSLLGNSGANVLDGKQGADTLAGGAGDDTYYVDDAGDVVTEGSNGGADEVRTSISYTLTANVERLVLLGAGGLTGTGNSLANILVGSAFDDTLDGASGTDTMIGGQGNDSYFVNVAADVVTELENEGTDTVLASSSYTLSDHLERLVLTGSSSSSGTGNALDNEIIGNSGANTLDGGLGNDTLDGGAGNDTLRGGAGDDLYIVDSTSDSITENAASGYDRVESQATFTLSLNVEELRLVGIGNINGTGSALDNILIGNSGHNVLSGGAGADNMTGGAGNDTYVVDNVGDTVVENANEGIDLVQSSITLALGDNVENLTLTGSSAISGTGNALDNTLTGNSGANTLTGGDGNDTLDGGSGADILVGGQGDDIYVFGSGDTITEAVGEGYDTLRSSSDVTLAANVERLELTGTSSIDGTGNALNNDLIGNSGANVLSGGLGADTMAGGAGNDTYVVDDSGDLVVEAGSEGTDLVQSSISYSLTANVENLTLTGSASLNGTGNALANVLTGNSGANTLSGGDGGDTLNGGTGADALIGGLGDDTYVVDNVGDTVSESAGEGTDTVQSSITYTLGSEVENLTLTGSSALNATGNTLANVLTGNSGANVLDGGAGADTLVGGSGSDTYIVDNVGDVVTETSSSGGTDLVQASVSFGLSANIENLTLTGTAAINGSGNDLANVLTGNSGDNVLTGGAGNDTYVIQNAADSIIEAAAEGTDLVQSSVSHTLAANVENLTLTGSASLTGTGNDLDNILTGNTGANTLSGGLGNDTLNGGTGNDSMSGGAGDDTYVVDVAGDSVTELSGEGIDTVQSAVAYTLGAHLENLTLTGSSAINGTGNTLNNVITGNSGANTLDGSAGADTLAGAGGNDTYIVDNVGDIVTENASAGTDLVQSSVTYTLAANAENLTLTGSAALDGTGNALANVLTGNTGTNILTGGAGDDTYVLQNAADSVVEVANEGVDLVQSSVSHTLSANVENLTLTGSSAIDGTGNDLDNLITGNTGANSLVGGAGNDTLSGGSGADTMTGGLGNDTYVVDNAGDAIVEAAGEGTDSVQSSITYTLGATLENLTLTGSSGIHATGNALDNFLTGNSGANTLTGGAGNDVLDGGSGNDTMVGGLGDDTYYVAQASDVVTELSGEGADLVRSSIAYTLGNHVENLLLTGSSAVNGTGNSLNNVLTGNSGANTLTGNAGDDELRGAGGADTLNGGDGADRYLFLAGDGAETINNSSSDSAEDRLVFSDLLRTQLSFSQSGNDLLIQRVGVATDSVRVTNWFSVTANQIEIVETSGGQTTTAAEINALIAGGGGSFQNGMGTTGPAPLSVDETPVSSSATSMLADATQANILSLWGESGSAPGSERAYRGAPILDYRIIKSLPERQFPVLGDVGSLGDGLTAAHVSESTENRWRLLELTLNRDLARVDGGAMAELIPIGFNGALDLEFSALSAGQAQVLSPRKPARSSDRQYAGL